MRDLKALREAKGFSKCKHCGTNNSQSLKYCKNCGHRLVVQANSANRKPKGTKLNRCKDYVETKLGIKEIDTKVIPMDGVNLSVMSMLAEEDARKRKKARLIKGITIVSCLTGVAGGYYYFDQQDLRAAKVAYANEEMETLLTLKRKMSFEDWQSFEKSRLTEINSLVSKASKGSYSPTEVLEKIEQLMDVIDDRVIKKDLEESKLKLQALIEDEEIYETGREALTKGDYLTAYKSFLSIVATHPKSKTIQSDLEQIESSALNEWKIYLNQLLDQKEYAKIVEEATLYLSIQPKDANIVAMKKQAEQMVRTQVQTEIPSTNAKPTPQIQGESIEVDQSEESNPTNDKAELEVPVLKEEVESIEKDQAQESQEGSNEEESQEEAQPTITYKSLKNEQTFYVGKTKLHFLLNRITPTIWPDKVLETSNSYQAPSGKMYFVYLFGITNEGTSNLDLSQLIQQASVTDGDGNSYEQIKGYYTKSASKLGKVEAGTVLKPGASTTMHVVIEVPKSLKTKVTPLTARIQIMNEWYQKDIPAQ